MQLFNLETSKKRILLLVAQHFQGGFPEDGEIERGVLRGGIGEDELMRQRGFAAPRRARDDVKREFRKAAAQNLIQARNPGRQFVDLHFIVLGSFSFRLPGIRVVKGQVRPHVEHQAHR